MIAASSSTQTDHRFGEFSWPGDDELRAEALKLLQSSGFTALRKLRCEVMEAIAIVHGVVPSYYLKQMAQTIILRLDGMRSVTNLVEVRTTEYAEN